MGLFACIHLDRWPVRPSPRDARRHQALIQILFRLTCNAPRCERNAYYPPHSHDGLTTHLILKGELTITYPEDKEPEKKTYGVGDRIDVEAGRVHEVWMGKEGCTYVIGE